ncbi:glycosyltransferase family 2 protein [Flavobacterium sp.]|jgi:glycosyltransferase involved in cell wall biosynthesis|uniref:glycosyltransferase family 2 protein n=1 Tax=Flavobacterium sp. TaxID=239 RepID=UPI0037BEFEDD
MKVSACIITYNHELFIEDCIKGAINQNIDYDYEIIIGEDCSTDNTFAICEQYALEYPDKIKLFRREKNLGLSGNWIESLKACSGDYIAICEGDDYWTDPNKLKLQLNLLINNNKYVFSFHDSLIYNLTNKLQNLRVGTKKIDKEPNIASVLLENNIRTETMVFKNTLDWNNLPFWFKNTLKIDYALILLLLENDGRAIYIDKTMSLCRVHKNTLWSSKSATVHNQEGLAFFTNFYTYTSEMKIKKLVKYKINFIKANMGIMLMRDGKIIKGLSNVVFYNNWFSKSFTIKLKKIVSAGKSGIFKRVHSIE